MRVAALAIVGLRRVRAAYAERVTAWRQLSNSQRAMDEEKAASAAALLANAAAAPPVAVAAVGAGAAVNGALRDVEDNCAQGGGPAGGAAPISREVKLRQQLAAHGATPAGQRSLKELRWLALTRTALTARLRNLLTRTGATEAQVSRAAAFFGGEFLRGGMEACLGDRRL